MVNKFFFSLLLIVNFINLFFFLGLLAYFIIARGLTNFINPEIK